MESLDAAIDRWIAALEAGQTLDLALDSAGEAFDFSAWLEQAIRQGWLDAVDVHAPSGATNNA